MADMATALSDLDSVVGDMETEVSNLQQQIKTGNQGATQAAADALEQRVTAMRTALAAAQSVDGTGAGGTTPPTGGGTTPPPAGGGTPTPTPAV